jgi:hypothetical protein
VPTILHLLGIDTAGMEGRPLRGALDSTADLKPVDELHDLPRDFVLEAMRAQDGRLYPSAMRRRHS